MSYHKKSTAKGSGVNSVVQQCHEGPKSLSIPLLLSSEYWLLISGLARHGARELPLPRSYVLAQVHPKAWRAGCPASLFLLGWKPFPEVPQPIHWPGLSQKPGPNCKGGWKMVFFFLSIFSHYSGNKSQPSQRKWSWGRERGKGCQLDDKQSATVEKFATVHDTVFFEDELSFRTQLKHKLHVVCVLDCIWEGTQGLI